MQEQNTKDVQEDLEDLFWDVFYGKAEQVSAQNLLSGLQLQTFAMRHPYFPNQQHLHKSSNKIHLLPVKHQHTNQCNLEPEKTNKYWQYVY